jgi:glycosyltransferase involved in cell wall biosynthesis
VTKQRKRSCHHLCLANPVDIALIIHELLVEGGGERQCVCLAQALARRGHAVTLYTSAYDHANCFPDICKDFQVRDVGRGALGWIKRPFFVRGYLDMKHMTAAIGRKHTIWNPHHWPAQWGALWLRKKLGGRVIWMCNDVPDFYHRAANANSVKAFLRAPLHWLYFLYDRKQNSQIDRAMFLSNWAEREYKAVYPGKTCVVRSGADPTRFAPGGDREKIRERFGCSPNEIILLWLGIFMPHRRLEDAIEAIAVAASCGVKARLLLAGSDRSYPHYVQALKQLVITHGLQNQVTFTGKVADGEIRDFYSACDAFLFPNDKQTWGLVVLEAMACGCLTIVSRGAGIHEVLTDGQNAILFTPRNTNELAGKIESVANDPESRRRIALEGMKLARGVYTWDHFAEQIERVCHEVTVEGQNPLPARWPAAI